MNDYIKNTSKKNQKIARSAAAYAYSGRAWNTYTDIFSAYERPSIYKVRAWDYCKRLCAECNGYDLIISSKNTMQFSACFKFDDPETGELCYGYITKDYDRFCKAAAC